MGISKIDGSLSREGIEESLQVKGQKIAPENLDTTFVKYVYETSQLSFLETSRLIDKSFTLDGLASGSIKLIGQKGTGAEVETEQQNAKILLCAFLVLYNAAGLAADIAAGVTLRWEFQSTLKAVTSSVLGGQHTVTNIDNYQYIQGIGVSAIPIIVPWNTDLTIRILRSVGTGNFPANTTLYFRGLVTLRKRGLYI